MAQKTDIQFTPQLRISNTTAWLMIAVALAADGIQFFTKFLHFIPVVGNISAVLIGFLVSVAASFSFWIWFQLHGVTLTDRNASKALIHGASTFVELIPIINAIPAWTMYVTLIIFMVRYEDKRYNIQQQEMVQNSVRAAQK